MSTRSSKTILAAPLRSRPLVIAAAVIAAAVAACSPAGGQSSGGGGGGGDLQPWVGRWTAEEIVCTNTAGASVRVTYEGLVEVLENTATESTLTLQTAGCTSVSTTPIAAVGDGSYREDLTRGNRTCTPNPCVHEANGSVDGVASGGLVLQCSSGGTSGEPRTGKREGNKLRVASPPSGGLTCTTVYGR